MACRDVADPERVTPPHLDITSLLLDWGRGDRDSREALFDAVYGELHAIATQQHRKEHRDETLQPTALVHEAYLKLIEQDRVDWRNRAQFYAVSAQIMRRILIDRARKRSAEKRGGGTVCLDLGSIDPGDDIQSTDVLALHDALLTLAEIDAEKARLVEMRFFAGLKFKDIAELEGVSVPTINRRWRAARAWLYRDLRKD